MPITEPDSDPTPRLKWGLIPMSKRRFDKTPLDADLEDPWWTTPCEDCGEVPISLVPYGVTECKCLRDKRKNSK